MWVSYSDIVKEEFVKYYQSVLYNQKVLANGNLKTIDLSKHDNIKVTQNYAYRGEAYPVVVIGSEGGSLETLGFNDDVGGHNDTFTLGTDYNSYVTIGYNSSGSASVAIKFSPDEDTELEHISLAMANSGLYAHSDIDVVLYEGGVVPGSGSVVSSGSIHGFNDTTHDLYKVGFGEDIDLDSDTDYWIEVSTDSSSQYYLFVDIEGYTNTIATRNSDSDSWTLATNKGLVGTVTGGTVDVLGGNVRVPITVQIAAKDSQTVDNIFDVLLLFTELARRYEYSAFEDNRIFIDKINFGGDTAPRELAGNIQIFVKQMTVNVVAAWTYNVSKTVLADIGITTTTFSK